jgi:hypothetical protein
VCCHRVGLSGSVWETMVGAQAITSYIRWTDESCSDSSDNPYCDNCDTGGKAAVFLVLVSCTTRIPSMMLLKARMNPISDIPLIKFLGMMCESLAAVSLSGAMFIWREYCHVQLPSPNILTYSYGSGFYMLTLGFCLTSILFVVHTLMPTEDPYDDISLLDEHLACCSAKSRAAVAKEKERIQKVKDSQVLPEGTATKKRRRRKKTKKTMTDVVSSQTEPNEQSGMDRCDFDEEMGGIEKS